MALRRRRSDETEPGRDWGLDPIAETARAGSAKQRFEYAVETVRSTLIGDKVKDDDVERLLNRSAGDGWQVKSITETEVKGRVGPGGTTGLLVVFERPVETVAA